MTSALGYLPPDIAAHDPAAGNRSASVFDGLRILGTIKQRVSDARGLMAVPFDHRFELVHRHLLGVNDHGL